MKHPGPAESVSPPPAATAVFGDRLDRAEAYYSLLAGDGVEHGLIGPREVPRLWERHILNCAVIGELIEPGVVVVDVGSGAGLPGIPVAIARPDLRVTLVEPLLRRSEFLYRTVEELGLDVSVVRGRAEEKVVRESVGGAAVVTSRAVAPLERLAKWSAPLIDAGGRLVAIKGSTAMEEIDRDRVSVERTGIGQLHVEECGGAVLETPTTVIVGTKQALGAGASRARRERRSRRAKEKG